MRLRLLERTKRRGGVTELVEAMELQPRRLLDSRG